MPDLSSLDVSPADLITAWYDWGVCIGFAIALVTTLWIVIDTWRHALTAPLWFLLSLVATLVIVPSVVLRIFPRLSPAIEPVTFYLAYAGTAASLIALFCLLLYSFGFGLRPLASPEALGYDPLPVPGPETPASSPPFTATSSGDAPQPASASAATASQKTPDQPLPLAWIVLMNGNGAGKTFPLETLTDIGCDAAVNDIIVNDPIVCRQHARIRLEDNRFVLYDLASTTGVLANGKPVQQHTLQNGDRIRIGKTEFGFMDVPE